MATYQKSNLAWELQQLTQNGREWVAWQTDRLWQGVPPIPGLDIPHWERWEELIFHSLLWLIIAVAIAAIWLNRRTWQRYWHNLTAVDLRPNFATPPPGASYWMRTAHQAARQGDYYQACRHLYLAMLQMLQEKRGLEPAPGRTDREYQRLTAQFPQASAYNTLFTIHQELCFGQQQASLELFEDCQGAIAQLEHSPRATTDQRKLAGS
ncbi:DUF4129 domain-containing protein [Synechocystis salina]|uniref:DUF4129 domain-containing protein n=1 Tax=Synechocystis salina LEGE 00031 TaxID=1828736 RepID=A0ABR9VNF2_9SYNC|nr:DUF4129 domain-containing protein [Synechocystis salina]MBE9240894.1 DUF4129 domain-containing protein [Synechocystis salina LEGE 00041]MBE9252596.1 DUF4129 domain-containing protein [Synechocystis salina LEGE 00031]